MILLHSYVRKTIENLIKNIQGESLFLYYQCWEKHIIITSHEGKNYHYKNREYKLIEDEVRTERNIWTVTLLKMRSFAKE